MLESATSRKLITFRSYIHEIEAGCRFKLLASSAKIFSVILTSYCEAILDNVLRASDQSIGSVIRRLVKVGAKVVYHAR